ncbi:phosphoglycerate mutase family protein [Archangium sp.]|jgi:broad specificity phosphatase PhoE|uniref:phosphoglycerate mutase family protein n=1 Tax=Archangium sp. TaxID=1872627 RepID=UPI002ED94FB9
MRTVTARLLSPVCLLLLVACAGARPAEPRGASPAPSASTVVLLVRHAEKATEGGDDPALTPAGRQRAEVLVQVAQHAGVSAISATRLRRTRETAQPLADRLGVPITVREVIPGGGRAQAAQQARDLLTQHRGQVVLVVGHSNTLPLVAEALAGVPIPPIPDSEYDRLMVVVVPPSGPARLIQSRYGAPSAP